MSRDGVRSSRVLRHALQNLASCSFEELRGNYYHIIMGGIGDDLRLYW